MSDSVDDSSLTSVAYEPPSIDAFSMLQRVSALHSAEDLNSIVEISTRVAKELTNAAGATFLLSDDVTRVTTVVPGNCGNLSPGLDRNQPSSRTGTFEEALQGTSPIADFSHFLGSLSDRPFFQLDRVVAVPVKRRQRLLGMLMLEFATPQANLLLSPNLRVFLEQAGVAIERVLLTNALDGLTLRLNGLSAVVSLHQYMCRHSESRGMFEQICRDLSKLIDVEIVVVLLYDPDVDQLILQEPYAGDRHAGLAATGLSIDAGGISATVFNTGKWKLTCELDDDPLVENKFLGASPIRTVLSFPLVNGDSKLGVLHLANKRQGNFDSRDIAIMSELVPLLTKQIQNLTSFREMTETVNGLQELNQTIDQQRERLQRVLTIHDELTRMVLDGHGIPGILAALYQIVHDPISVEDRFFNMIGYYPREDTGDLDLGRRRAIANGGSPFEIDSDPEVQLYLTPVNRDKRPVKMPSIPRLGYEIPRVLAPIVVGGQVLAHIFVLESNRSLDELDFVALEQTATAIGLRLMTEKAAAEVLYKQHGDLMAELLSGNAVPDQSILARAAYLDIDLNKPRAVLVMDVDRPRRDVVIADESNLLGIRQTMLDTVRRACRRYCLDAVIWANSNSDEMVILGSTVASRPEDQRMELSRLGDMLRSEVNRWFPEISVSVGVGGVSRNLSGHARSYREALRALDFVRSRRERNTTVSFYDLGIYGEIIHCCGERQLREFVDDQLGNLLRHGLDHQVNLVETLEIFLCNDGHLERSASALNLHLSTFRYRLQRVEQVLGRELDSTEAKLNLQLALKLMHLLGPEAESRVNE